jgi:hypothetical protein
MVYELLQDYFVPSMILQVDFIFLWDMWAHYLWSCSPVRVAFACGTMIISFRKKNQWPLTHSD